MRKQLDIAWRFVSMWIFLSLLVSAAAARGTHLQGAKAAPPAVSRDASPHFQVGARTVVIPAPEGYVNALPSAPQIKNSLEGLDHDIELLAMHVPKDNLEEAQRNLPNLSQYTVVGVVKETKDEDLTESDFPKVVAAFKERQSSSTGLFDLNDPRVKAALELASQKVSAANGEKIEAGLQQPVNLGIVEEKGDRLIFLMLLKWHAQINGKRVEAPFVASVSVMRVNHRLLFAYAFHPYVSDGDVLAVKEFTQQWIGGVIAANPK